MMKKRAYMYAVVAVAVAAVIIVSYTLFGQGSPQLGRGGQAQEIVPANVPTSELCPLLFKGQVVSSVKYSSAANIGIYNLTHNQTNNFQDFVIAPGHTGTITYKISAMIFEVPNGTASLNVTNGFYLIHNSHRIVKENVTQFNISFTRYSNNTIIYFDGRKSVLDTESHIRIVKGTMVTFPNGTTLALANDTYVALPNGLQIGTTKLIAYKACYPGTCYSGPGPRPPEFLNISFDNYSHLGINISFSPKSELVYSNNIAYTNLTIAVALTTLPGTYLLSVFTTNEVCEGPFAYLTIGTVPYSGNAPSIGII